MTENEGHYTKRYEASLGFIAMVFLLCLTLVLMCGLTFQFGTVALASAEVVLGVRGDGVPPTLSVPPPPIEVGITPLPTTSILEPAPTITRVGETITNTQVITP